MEFLRENAAQIAAWMPLVALIVTVASLAAFMGARARGDRRQFLWLNLTGASVIALIVMFGPMSPCSPLRERSTRGVAALLLRFRFETSRLVVICASTPCEGVWFS